MILFGEPDGGFAEVQISAVEHVGTDFDELTDHGAVLMCESIRSTYTDYGYDVASVDMYDAPEGHRFVRAVVSYAHEEGYQETMVEYLTCQAGYSVSIVLYPGGIALTESQLLCAELLADSMWVTAVN